MKGRIEKRMIPLRGGLSALIFEGTLKKQPMNTELSQRRKKCN